MKALPIVFCSLLFLVCCRYDDEVSVRYIGKYRCIHTSSCYGALGNCYSQVVETLSVRQGATDSTFAVFGGDYYIGSDGCCSGYHFNFCFSGDSLHAGFMNGGLGGGVNESYQGVKISNTP